MDDGILWIITGNWSVHDQKGAINEKTVEKVIRQKYKLYMSILSKTIPTIRSNQRPHKPQKSWWKDHPRKHCSVLCQMQPRKRCIDTGRI